MRARTIRPKPAAIFAARNAPATAQPVATIAISSITPPVVRITRVSPLAIPLSTMSAIRRGRKRLAIDCASARPRAAAISARKGASSRSSFSTAGSSESESEAYFNLAVAQLRDRNRHDQRTAAGDAGRPVGERDARIVLLDVLPIGLDESAVPLIDGRNARLMEQRHAEPRGLVLVGVEDLHEARALRRVLQIVQLVLDRRRDPLHGVAEQVQQQKALHLEADVGI